MHKHKLDHHISKQALQAALPDSTQGNGNLSQSPQLTNIFLAADKAQHHMLPAGRQQLFQKMVLTVVGTSSRPWLLSSLLKLGSGVLDLLLWLLLLV